MATAERAAEIAETILKQMGGEGRLVAMIGAKNFSFDRDGTLNFQFQGGRRAGGNYVSIKLDPSDTYTMTFFDSKFAKKGEYEGLYWNSLKPTFEKHTGLYLTL